MKWLKQWQGPSRRGRTARRWMAVTASLLAAWCVQAAEPGEQMQFADGLYTRGLYDLAIKEYVQIVSTAPTFEHMDQVLYRIGECYRMLKQAAPADLFYKRTIREYAQSPYAAKAEYRRAELFVANNQYADAAGLFAALIERKPPEDVLAGAWYNLGFCRARLDQGAEAEKAYREVLAKFPTAPYASLAALELAERRRAAGAGAEELRGFYEAALKHPASPEVGAEAALRLADLAFRAGDYAASSLAYERLLRAYAASPQAAASRLQAMWSYYHTGRFADGLALATAALKEPEPPAHMDEYLYLMAHFQRQLLDAAAASETYTRLLREFPESPLAATAAYEKALMAFKAGDFKGAVEQAAAIVPPTDAMREDLHWLLAESYTALNDQPHAIQYYRLIVDAAGDARRAPDALYRLGRLLQDRKDWAEASAMFRRLAEKFPKNELAAQALYASGFCQAKLDQFREAVIDWTRLLTDAPTSPLAEEAGFQKALAELRLERDAQARDTLQKWIAAYPASPRLPEARFWRSRLLEKANELEAAVAELRLALDAKPEPEWTRKIKYQLAGLLQKQEKWDECAALLQELLGTASREEFPPELLRWLAEFQLGKAQAPAAAAAAEALAARTPGQESWQQVAFFLIGEAARAQGKIENALQAYEKAVLGKPVTMERVAASCALADIHLQEKRMEQALAAYTQAAEWAADPKLAGLKARALLGIGLAQEALQRTDQALRGYLAVSILYDDPERTPEAMYRAWTLMASMKKDAERAALFEEMKQRYPESPWTKKVSDADK